jgi:hypothetical protein
MGKAVPFAPSDHFCLKDTAVLVILRIHVAEPE